MSQRRLQAPLLVLVLLSIPPLPDGAWSGQWQVFSILCTIDSEISHIYYKCVPLFRVFMPWTALTKDFFSWCFWVFFCHFVPWFNYDCSKFVLKYLMVFVAINSKCVNRTISASWFFCSRFCFWSAENFKKSFHHYQLGMTNFWWNS